MGVTISANGSNISFDMGYVGFHILRCAIAQCVDSVFGRFYESSYTTAEEFNRVIKKRNLTCDRVLAFLFMPDCNGSVDYKTCKEILSFIKDVDFGDRCFRYAAYADNDYEEFKQFLAECVKYHRSMRWS